MHIKFYFVFQTPTQVQNICCARWEKYTSFLPHKSKNHSWLLPQRVDPIKLVLGPFSFADRGQETAVSATFQGPRKIVCTYKCFRKFMDKVPMVNPRRLLRSSRPQEICQPPPRGFFCVRTCPVAASRKYFSAIHTSPHLNSRHTWSKNNIILHLLLVLCTAVNVRNKN